MSSRAAVSALSLLLLAAATARAQDQAPRQSQAQPQLQAQSQSQSQSQENDLTLPPRLDVDRPGAASLAPARTDREPVLEEVIVVNESEWRLPDLGSSWRQQEAEATDTSRIEVRFLPLYDPENDDPTVDMFPRRLEVQRVGFIELFRLRFGHRPE